MQHPANTMNKDGCYTSVHMHHPRTADLFEDVCKDRLPSDDILVPPQHQPVNPEDEDDVVPDQHAAFGIQRATQAVREPAWRDLGLAALMRRGRGGNGGGETGAGAAGETAVAAAVGGGAAGGGGGGRAPSYAYYAYYYGYNANGVVGGGLAGVGGVGGSSGSTGRSGGPAVERSSSHSQRLPR